jgi:hypothetical protein
MRFQRNLLLVMEENTHPRQDIKIWKLWLYFRPITIHKCLFHSYINSLTLLFSSPRTTTLSKHMLQVRRLASSYDPYSYAGMSVSSWHHHPSQKGQWVGARLSVVHWSSKLGVGSDSNNSTPQKVSCYET